MSSPCQGWKSVSFILLIPDRSGSSVRTPDRREICTFEDEHETSAKNIATKDLSSRIQLPEKKTRAVPRDGETREVDSSFYEHGGPHWGSFVETGHRSATIPVIVLVVVVVVVGMVVAAFSNGWRGCLGVVFVTFDSWWTFVSSKVVCRSQMYSITLCITSSFDNFRFLGMSGTKDLSFVR